MMKKQRVCTPTCRMPSKPAKQANSLISLQQATSRALRGRTKMLAKPDVAEVVPSRTK